MGARLQFDDNRPQHGGRQPLLTRLSPERNKTSTVKAP